MDIEDWLDGEPGKVSSMMKSGALSASEDMVDIDCGRSACS